MQVCTDLSAGQENPSAFWFGPWLTIVISSTEDIKTVLTSPNCLKKPYVYNFFGRNTGIFNSEGNLFRIHRTSFCLKLWNIFS